MTYRVRKVNDAMIAALVKAHNDQRRSAIAAEVHYDVSGAGVTGDPRNPIQNDLQVAAAGSDGSLPVLLTLTNDITNVYVQHIDDVHVHDAFDDTNVITSPVATDLATAQTLLNELKAQYNSHRSEGGVHPNNDGGNDITAADATNQATSDTLADELKLDLNAHINAALAGQGIELVDP